MQMERRSFGMTLAAGEHLLKENGLSLSPECIFLNIDSKELAFCYTPFQKKPFMDALRGFMEYYLSHMEHNNGDGTKKCYEVYEKCQKEHLALEELLSVLFEEKLELKEELETTEEPGVIREDVQIEPYAEGPSILFAFKGISQPYAPFHPDKKGAGTGVCV